MYLATRSYTEPQRKTKPYFLAVYKVAQYACMFFILLMCLLIACRKELCSHGSLPRRPGQLAASVFLLESFAPMLYLLDSGSVHCPNQLENASRVRNSVSSIYHTRASSRYLEEPYTSGAKPWVWVLLIAFGPITSSLLEQRYLVHAVRTLSSIHV